MDTIAADPVSTDPPAFSAPEMQAIRQRRASGLDVSETLGGSYGSGTAGHGKAPSERPAR